MSGKYSDDFRANGLFAHADKCEFHVTSCEYLGYMLSPEGLTMAPYKVQIIQDWPRTSKVKDVQSFLGFANFLPSFHFRILRNHSSAYASYPQGYHLALFPMSAVSFEALKKAFTTAPVLTHWIPDTQINSRNRHFRLCSRCWPFDYHTEWRVAPYCIPLADLFPLRNSITTSTTRS